MDLKAALVNNGHGRFHDYLEFDVYHADDLETVVWAGALDNNEAVVHLTVLESTSVPSTLGDLRAPTSNAVANELDGDESVVFDEGLALIDPIKATSSIANAVEFAGLAKQPAMESPTESSTTVEVVWLDTTRTAATAPTTFDASLNITPISTPQATGLIEATELTTGQLETASPFVGRSEQSLPKTLIDADSEQIVIVNLTTNPS